jgi:hypothetical protein
MDKNLYNSLSGNVISNFFDNVKKGFSITGGTVTSPKGTVSIDESGISITSSNQSTSSNNLITDTISPKNPIDWFKVLSVALPVGIFILSRGR